MFIPKSWVIFQKIIPPLDRPSVCSDRRHLVGQQEVRWKQGYRGWGKIFWSLFSEYSQRWWEPNLDGRHDFYPKLIFFPDREPSSHADQKSIMYLIVLSSPTSTAPTSPRCSPSGTLRRPPLPPRPTEKTWQVPSLSAIRKDRGTLLSTYTGWFF